VEVVLTILRMKKLRAAAFYLLVLVSVAYLIGPFVWLVGTSLMGEKEAQLGHWVPRRPTAVNYRAFLAPDPKTAELGAATARKFVPAIGNSLIVAGWVTALNLLLGSLAAYALARIPFRGGMGLLLFYLGSRSVPGVAIMIPMYLMMQGAGLLDTKLSVILAHITFTLPFTIWLLRGYFHTVPVDLERAARVDGCSRLQAMWHVVLPLAAPGLVTAALFAFLGSWNEFLFALVLNSRVDQMMVQPAIAGMYSMTMQEYGLMGAGSVLGALPTILLTLVFQRYLVQGLLSGGVKG
jgi:multiple sugar transport system permease protein